MTVNPKKVSRVVIRQVLRSRLAQGVLIVSAGSAVVVLASACSGPGNTGRRPIDDQLAADVPWVRGRGPLIDGEGHVIIPPEPVYPNIASGEPDPGSRPYDCSPTEGLEFSSVWYENFEADPSIPDGVGIAQAWSSFDDFSDGLFRMPAEINWYSGLSGRHPGPWGLPAQRIEGAPSCNEERNDWALHFKAGRFNRYSGGIGHPLAEINPCQLDENDEPVDAGLCWQGEPVPGIDLDPADAAVPTVHAFWNVSAYDGVSFWARRGPEGQGQYAFLIFDKYTSDDLNRENETFCRRIKPCRSQCINNLPCTQVPDSDEFRCWDPALGEYPTQTAAGNAIEPALENEIFPLCGRTACNGASDFPDPDFDGKECRPYTFEAHETGEYCFNEDDLPPPEADTRCGDGYGGFFQVSTDWKFIKIPFREMRQNGFGKISPEIDLTTISNIAIVSAKGWVDLYLDNLSFYKEAN